HQGHGARDAGDREHLDAALGAEDVVDADEQGGDQQQRDHRDADHQLAVEQALTPAAALRRRLVGEGRAGHQDSWRTRAHAAAGPRTAAATHRTAGRTPGILPAVRWSAAAFVAQALPSRASASWVKNSV